MRSAAVVESPVGRLGLEAEDDRLTRVRFHARGAPTGGRLPGVLGETRRQLKGYFAGALEIFDLPLDPAGTPFQISVWRALQDIPYGRTSTYADLARRLGRPSAVRAVGAANGRNPIPIIIPCHRVIGSDGRLVGFGGGLAVKRQLLSIENALLF
jgi:methylated-DNA-[protein]-cysteine S-methyltransferase